MSLQHTQPQGPGEPRTLTQLRTDVLTDLLIDGVTPSGLGTGIRATVNVTVPVLTLMGLSEEAGHLEGYGPIDPDTARRLAAGAPSFTRLLVHPETGVVLSVGRTRYKVPKDLKRWLRIRDETCRFPGCNQPAAHSDLDHSLDWQFQGITAHDNLAHLCPGCHALKSETGWSLKHLGDGRLEWTSPTGRSFNSEPATELPADPPTF
ncbi:HNH endonuclease [Cryobacterium tagatosivorans]|uniref:HNH endonuclease n=1 Tax=Cryobacterium tagatosivorans TaxID=1259199 RepID=UPI0030B9BFC2